MENPFLSFITKIGVICLVMGCVRSQATETTNTGATGESTVTEATGATGATGTGTETGAGVTEVPTTLASVVSTAKPESTAASIASTAASVASTAASKASTAASAASTSTSTTPRVSTVPTSVATAKSPSKPLAPVPTMSKKELADFIKEYFDKWLIQQGLKTKEPTTPKTTTTGVSTKPLDGKDSVPRVPSKAPVQVSPNNFPQFNSRTGSGGGAEPPRVPTNDRDRERGREDGRRGAGGQTQAGAFGNRYAASNRGTGYYQQGSRSYQQGSRNYQQGSRGYQQGSRGYQQGSRGYLQESRTYQRGRYPRVRQISSRNFFQG